MKKLKMNKKAAHNLLYSMWEKGEVPANFTEDHSEYSKAVKQIMFLGYLVYDDFF